MARKLNKTEIEDVLGISPLQEGMLYHYLKDTDSKSYREQLIIKLNMEFKKDEFILAWEKVFIQNPVLRTVFRWEGLKKPVQIILKNEYPKLEIHYDNGKQISEPQNFNLEEIPLRILFYKDKNNDHSLVIEFHHIILDGWSTGILLKEFFENYHFILKGINLPVRHKAGYKEFLQFIQKQKKEELLKYWKEHLIITEPCRLSDIGFNAGQIKKENKILNFEISGSEIDRYSKKENITQASIIYGIWAVVLKKHINSDNICFGTTISGRNIDIDNLENTAGLFINTIPLYINLENKEKLKNVPLTIHRLLSEREDFENISLSDIISESSAKSSDLFDSIVVIENYPLDKEVLAGIDIKIESIEMNEQTNFPLTLGVTQGNNLMLTISYSSDIFSDDQIEDIKDSFIKVAGTLVNDPEMNVGEISVISRKQKNLILNKFNDTYADYPQNKTIHQIFEEQVQLTPDNVALVFENREMSYGELNTRSNAVANALRSKGVKQDDIVGIMIDRSFEMIVGIFGILKSGGAYLPIDLNYPEERISYMLKDSGADILLTRKRSADQYGLDTIDLEDESLYAEGLSDPEHINTSSDLAYIIYTSGTTGMPKGVMVEHRNVVNMAFSQIKEFGINDTERILQFSNINFDASVEQINIALLTGAALVLVGNNVLMDSAAFSDFISDNNITHIHAVPAFINTIIPKKYPSLKRMIAGGDVCQASLVKKWVPFTTFYNEYGPTETTVTSTELKIQGLSAVDPIVSIGSPVANTRVYILNKNYHLQPVGVPGELYIGGDGVTRGYLKRPELTSEKFIWWNSETFEVDTESKENDNSFRIYRTGDFARWLPDGNIEFLGRIDDQVKIRGFRIELGEIANEILSVSGIKDVVVTAGGSDDNKYISAYYVTEKESQISKSELSNIISGTLPDYMLPSYYIELEMIPLTSNGKPDKKSLPQPEFEDTEKYTAPSTELEHNLVQIWSEILQIPSDNIGTNTTFMNIGGNSIKIMSLVSLIHKDMGVKLTISEIFENLTVKRQAELIGKKTESSFKPIPKSSVKDNYLLSPAQNRMYLLQRMDPDSTAYNMPAYFSIDGYSVTDIKKATGKLIERHGSFRTSFVLVNDQPFQKVAESSSIDIEEYEISSELELNEVFEKFIRPFDLEKAPLLRLGYIKCGTGNYLMADMHHIISDGASVEILQKEFFNILEGMELTPLGLQYTDYSEWQQSEEHINDIARQKEYWINEFSDNIPVLELPYDYNRQAEQSFEGASISYVLDRKYSMKIREVSRKYGTTHYITFLSLFNILLSKLSNGEDIVVGSPVSGREHPDLDHIIGMFVNTLAIRNGVDGKSYFKDFLYKVKNKVSEAFDNQLCQFEDIVESLDVIRDLGRNPLFDVSLNLINTDEVIEESLSGHKKAGAKFDLSLDIVVNNDDMELTFNYCTKLFKAETIDRFIVYFENIIRKAEDGIRICDINILPEEEKHQLIYDFNSTEAGYPCDKTAHELFGDQVKRIPYKTALVCDGKELSYSELNERSNRLTHTLKEKGIKPDDIVGIIADRSFGMVVSILGVLKAGGAYLPIDPQYPSERIEYMISDAGVRILLAEEKYQKLAGDSERFEKLSIDNENIYSKNSLEPENVNSPDNLCYVIYTSGSTGQPKGVMIEHKSLVNYVYFGIKNYIREKHASFSLHSSFAFDLTVSSLFLPLLSGGSIHIYPENEEELPIEKILKERTTDIIKLTPSHLRVLKELNIGSTSIDRMIVGGEELQSSLAGEIQSKFNQLEIFNEYGPTEATVGCMIYRYEPSDKTIAVPVGIPASNTKIFILDRNYKLVPSGVAGQLCIGGDGLARGYMKNEALTAEKFVWWDPSKEEVKEENDASESNVVRIYLSGDLAKMNSKGNVEFLGRMDDQVKVRGFRIELGEIETALNGLDGISGSVVQVIEKGADKYLCAYVLAEKGVIAEIDELKEKLSHLLPEYMIPAKMIQLDRFPLTVNGKIDKRSLPVPDSVEEEYTAPVSMEEKIIAKVWAEVLGLKKIGINDNYFSVGGDSIKTIQIQSKLRKEGYRVSIKDFFSSPTIAKLSSKIIKISGRSEEDSAAGEFELIPIQKWFFETDDDTMDHYNQSVILDSKEKLDERSINSIFRKLLEHHDVLRSVFRIKDGRYFQNISEKVKEVIVDLIDLSGETDLNRRFNKECNRIQSSLNINNGPLIRSAIIRTPEGDKLFIAIHHLVVDGVSWRILLEDIEALYNQYKNGSQLILPQKTSSFMSWSEKIREYSISKELLKQITFWKGIQESSVPETDDALQEHELVYENIEKFSVEFNRDLTYKLLRESNQAFNTDVKDILITAFLKAYNKVFGHYNVKIAVEGHGREEIDSATDLSRTVGWFTSLYPVAFNFSEKDDLSVLVRKVKETLRSIPSRGLGYGILKYITPIEYKEGINFESEPDIEFNYLGQFNESSGGKGPFSYSGMQTGSNISYQRKYNYLISVNAVVTDDKLKITTGYNKKMIENDKMDLLNKIMYDTVVELIGICTSPVNIYTPSDLTYGKLTIGQAEKISSDQIEDIYPLTPMQEGMLYHSLVDSGSPVYFEQISYKYNGVFDEQIFEKSINEIFKRYDILRTEFDHSGYDIPLQIVLKERKVQISYDDLSMYDENLKEGKITEFKQKDRLKSFDLSKDPLMRLGLLKLSDEEYAVVWSFHHILMDGWCLGIISSEFFKIYESFVSDRQYILPDPVPYRIFIEWIMRKDVSEGLEYWRRYLDGFEQVTTLSFVDEPVKGEYELKEQKFILDPEETSELKKYASDNFVTFNTFFQAVWSVILSGMTGSDDIVFGSVVAGRPSEIDGIERMVGLFINTLPVRIKTDEKILFRELLQNIQKKYIESEPYQYVSLAEIQSSAALTGELFDHIMIFENYPLSEQLSTTGTISEIEVFEQTSFDLNILITVTDRLNINFQYNGRVYSDEQISRMINQIRNVISVLKTNKDIRLADISILSKDEEDIIINKLNDPIETCPVNVTIRELFESQAGRTPGSIALVCDGKEMTYRELNNVSDRLALLLKQKGAGKDKVIGFMTDRSFNMAIAIFGILKSGSAYLPIDPIYPPERIRYILEDSGAELLVTENQFISEELKITGIDIVDINNIPDASGDNAMTGSISSSSDLAYVIYTSGSTGKPKGVMIEHGNMVNFINGMKEHILFSEGLSLLSLTTVSFDIFGLELFIPLVSGMKVVIGENRDQNDPERILSLIDNYNIDILQLTPSRLQMLLLSQTDLDKLKNVKYLLLGGEPLPQSVLNDVRKYINGKIHNVYGPTETTVWSTIKDLTDEKNINIGRPILNTGIYILNKNNRLLPIGAAGELCISGTGVGRGYLNKPELSKEKFIDNPFGPGKLYRTGDLARWKEDGNIDFLGRMDDQVKIRGFRIELGEVEKVLSGITGIRESVVITKGEGADKYLAAYLVTDPDFSLDRESIRNKMIKELPDYMVPAYFIGIDRVPLTVNGKTDKRSLPEPAVEINEYLAPRNETEHKLVQIWSEVLKLDIERISVETSFFSLGGNSIKIMSLIAKINNRFGIKLNISDFFDYQTISLQSQFIDLIRNDEDADDTDVEEEIII